MHGYTCFTWTSWWEWIPAQITIKPLLKTLTVSSWHLPSGMNSSNSPLWVTRIAWKNPELSWELCYVYSNLVDLFKPTITLAMTSLGFTLWSRDCILNTKYHSLGRNAFYPVSISTNVPSHTIYQSTPTTLAAALFVKGFHAPQERSMLSFPQDGQVSTTLAWTMLPLPPIEWSVVGPVLVIFTVWLQKSLEPSEFHQYSPRATTIALLGYSLSQDPVVPSWS